MFQWYSDAAKDPSKGSSQRYERIDSDVGSELSSSSEDEGLASDDSDNSSSEDEQVKEHTDDEEATQMGVATAGDITNMKNRVKKLKAKDWESCDSDITSDDEEYGNKSFTKFAQQHSIKQGKAKLAKAQSDENYDGKRTKGNKCNI